MLYRQQLISLKMYPQIPEELFLFRETKECSEQNFNMVFIKKE